MVIHRYYSFDTIIKVSSYSMASQRWGSWRTKKKGKIDHSLLENNPDNLK